MKILLQIIVQKRYVSGVSENKADEKEGGANAGKGTGGTMSFIEMPTITTEKNGSGDE